MQSFGQPPGSPLGNPYGNPLDEDPLNDPLAPFADPFGPMLNSLQQDAIAGGYPSAPFPTGQIQDPLVETGSGGMDSRGKQPGHAESNVD